MRSWLQCVHRVLGKKPYAFSRVVHGHRSNHRSRGACVAWGFACSAILIHYALVLYIEQLPATAEAFLVSSNRRNSKHAWTTPLIYASHARAHKIQRRHVPQSKGVGRWASVSMLQQHRPAAAAQQQRRSSGFRCIAHVIRFPGTAAVHQLRRSLQHQRQSRVVIVAAAKQTPQLWGECCWCGCRRCVLSPSLPKCSLPLPPSPRHPRTHALNTNTTKQITPAARWYQPV